MEEITKNPALNYFLSKYNKKNWNQIVLKLSLIALSYLRSLSYQNIIINFNDLDQVLFRLESLNISQIRKKRSRKSNKEKIEFSEIYKPPIDNQLKNMKKDKFNLQEEYNKEISQKKENIYKITNFSNQNEDEEKSNFSKKEKDLSIQEDNNKGKNNKISSLNLDANKNENKNKKENIKKSEKDLSEYINEPFLNTDKYDENLTNIPRIRFPSYNLKDCNPCHPCHDLYCSKCNYVVGNIYNIINEKINK